MTDRFKLEQEIFQCWNVCDDLEVLLNGWDSLTEDQRLNCLIGMQQLYQLKFQGMFNTFEQCIKDSKV